MSRSCCLAAISSDRASLIVGALQGAGESTHSIVTYINVADLSELSPDVLIVDLDDLEVDSLETLRRLRFVLPECVLVVYTGVMKASWGRECHLAGANCLLSKQSGVAELTVGIKHATQSGCWTDPRLAA